MGDDTLEEAKRYLSKLDAVLAFESEARQLWRIGQSIEASLHYARNRDALQEYPDFVLSLGPRGGVKCEPA